MLKDKGVYNEHSSDGKFVKGLSSLDQTGRPFQGNPTFPGGYPKNTASPEYPGFITYPTQAVTIAKHWRATNVIDKEPIAFDYLTPWQKEMAMKSLSLYSPDMQSMIFNREGLNRKYEGTEFYNQYLSPDKVSDDSQYMVTNKAEHFIADFNDPSSLNIIDFDRIRGFKRNPNSRELSGTNGISYNVSFDTDAKGRALTYLNEFRAFRPVFSGSVTIINPFHDEKMNTIIQRGLEHSERLYVNGWETEKDASDASQSDIGAEMKSVPLSPIQTFSRIQLLAKEEGSSAALTKRVKQMIFNTYNRTHTPVADVEFRKGFRHIFFSRPECYVTYAYNNTVGLCEQAKFNEDFLSLWHRMPHLVELLGPSYMGRQHVQALSGFADNWNYLLSNRVLSMSTNEETLTQKETMTKTAEGYTILPGLHMESRTGSTISVSFKDTKDLEVYEFIKAWMLYIHNRARGIFAPSYNGYRYQNGFYETNCQRTTLSGVARRFLHPYDRALEYTVSLFDIVTNEADTKIIYWCKYYGIYPISVSSPISNDTNGPLTNESMKIDVTFRYQYKLPGVEKSLIEFNYNSGICNELGELIRSGIPEFSHSFMVKDATSYLQTDTRRNSYPTQNEMNQLSKDGNVENRDKRSTYAGNSNPLLKNYVGAAGLFVGTPMILIAAYGPSPLGGESEVTFPVLRFADINNHDLNMTLNQGHVLKVQPGDGVKIKYMHF